MERLNNAVKNGAISSVTNFISETGSGSAAELLSGRREMAETTSSTLTGVKDTRDAPGRTDGVLSHSIDFVVEELTEFVDAYVRTGRWLPTSKQQVDRPFVDAYVRTGRWLPTSKQQVDRPPEFTWRRTFTLNRGTPICVAFTTTQSGMSECHIREPSGDPTWESGGAA